MALICFLKELEAKYRTYSRITATIADYTEGGRPRSLYRKTLSQAKAERDVKTEKFILESLAEMGDEKRAQPYRRSRGRPAPEFIGIIQIGPSHKSGSARFMGRQAALAV